MSVSMNTFALGLDDSYSVLLILIDHMPSRGPGVPLAFATARVPKSAATMAAAIRICVRMNLIPSDGMQGCEAARVGTARHRVPLAAGEPAGRIGLINGTFGEGGPPFRPEFPPHAHHH